MPVSCKEHYAALHAACGEVLRASFEHDAAGLHSFSHGFITDLERWHTEVLARRPEHVVLASAISEYQFGLLAVAQGQYRQAFMALRLTLELLLATVLFSAHELDLRVWLAGQKDLVWSALIDANNGPLSKAFVRAFYDSLGDEAPHYRTMAEKVYRECSEHVHGNAQAVLESKLTFQEGAFQDWHAKAKTIRLISSFALCARYVNIIDADARSRLEPVLMENLGHLPALRAIYGAPVEMNNA